MRRPVLRLAGMALTVFAAVLLMAVSCLLWSAYVSYGTPVTGFSRLSLFFFGVMPMALLALRFLLGERQRADGVYVPVCALTLVNQAVLTVQNVISFGAGVTRGAVLIRSVLLCAGAILLFSDSLLRRKRRIPGFAGILLMSGIWIWWFAETLSGAISVAPYSEAVLRFGLLECGQILARLLFMGGLACYLLWKR